ncbi:MAG TPA: FtsX-like permease family protein, partial [Gemmatimonadales bacterium]|nr:FtsX-like permease family protein [Gemmatimonadales bacterium]
MAVLGRLAPGVPVDPGNVRATAIYRESLAGTRVADSTATVLSRGLIPGRGQDGSIAWPEARVAVWLQGVSLALLLVAVANVTNLLLLRATQRRREYAVRLALGIGRGRLVRQAMAESLLVAIAGGLLATLLAGWGGQVIRRTLMTQFVETPTLDARVVAVIAVFALLAALPTGLVPATLATRARLGDVLRAGGRGSAGGGSSLQRGLLLVQVALSVVLLVGAGLFVRSLRQLTTLDLGMEPDRVLVVRTNLAERGWSGAEIERTLHAIAARMATLPGVEGTALGQSVPYNPSLWTPLALPGHERLPGVSAEGLAHPTYFAVTPDYFATMGMRVVHGRGLLASDVRGSERVLLVDETMARR